jgi:hypothetical protein
MLTLTTGPEGVGDMAIVTVGVALGCKVALASTARVGAAVFSRVCARLGVGVSNPGTAVTVNVGSARRVCSADTVASTASSTILLGCAPLLGKLHAITDNPTAPNPSTIFIQRFIVIPLSIMSSIIKELYPA